METMSFLFFEGSQEKVKVKLQETVSKPKKSEILKRGEIDCSMGASFSDALVMCGEVSNKKPKHLKRPSQETSNIRPRSKQRKQNTENNNLPNDLIVYKKKYDNIISVPKKEETYNAMKIIDNYIPNVTNPNIMKYKCLPVYREVSNIPKIDNFNIGISSKTKRTKVYSGLKTGALLTVPSLFDICIRVLQKNVDGLEYTGGVPFDVLRPVLERASPQQLFVVEGFNAYLLEDTESLWEQHVKRNFRKETKQEGESWRDMFMRCETEKECKLNILTTNIKKAQKESAIPIRKTRLAYVDHVAKPPRNVQRQQEIFGTNVQPIASPAARVPSLFEKSSNVVKCGDPRLKDSRNFLHSRGNMQIQQKRAPLMAKTLKFIKKRYKK